MRKEKFITFSKHSLSIRLIGSNFGCGDEKGEIDRREFPGIECKGK